MDTPSRANSKICNAISDFWEFRRLCHGPAIRFECCDWREGQATEDQALLFANHTTHMNWCSTKILHLCVSGTFPVPCYTCLQFTYLPPPLIQKVLLSHMSTFRKSRELSCYIFTYSYDSATSICFKRNKGNQCYYVAVTPFPKWIASVCQVHCANAQENENAIKVWVLEILYIK